MKELPGIYLEHIHKEHKNLPGDIRKAHIGDVKQIYEKLEIGAVLGFVLPRDILDIEKNIDTIFLYVEKHQECGEEQIISMAFGEKYDDTFGEVRSVISIPNGYAKYVVPLAIWNLYQQNVSEVYLTAKYPEIFSKYGFEKDKGGDRALWWHPTEKQKAQTVYRHQSDYVIRPAEQNDVEWIKEQIAFEAKQGNVKEWPDMPEHIKNILVCMKGDTHIGLVAIVPHGKSKRIAEVRALIIDPLFRGEGAGMALVEKVEELLINLRYKEVLTTAYDSRIFQKFNFKYDTVGNKIVWLDWNAYFRYLWESGYRFV